MNGSYARRFVTSVLVGTIACLGLDVAVSIGHRESVLWHLVWFGIASSLVLVSSALGAAAVWSPFQSRVPLPRKMLAGIFYSGAIATAAFLARNLLRSVAEPLDLLRTPFYIVFFGVLLAVTVLPILLIVRPWIGTLSVFTVVATAFFPLPIIAGSVVEGQSLSYAAINCLPWSIPMLMSALPFIAGTMALGWAVGPSTRATQR